MKRLALREVRRRRFYRRFLAADDLCFDVGANRGDRTEVFLRLGARVVAIEPQRLCQDRLRRRFGGTPGFTLVAAAVGPEAGEATLYQPEPESGLASMSSEWIERVSASGRFGSTAWEIENVVEITTLDSLIERHGLPAFCKIDVEGFEYEVLLGLGAPLPALALEFTPEHLGVTLKCVERLMSLGAYEFNYVIDDGLSFAERSWLDAAALAHSFDRFRGDTRSFGDLYARLRA